jgi:hypothetical protein
MKTLVSPGILACFSIPGLSQSVFPVRDDGEGPSRDYHVIHDRIEVSFDFDAGSLPALERIARDGDDRSAAPAKASAEKIRKRTG